MAKQSREEICRTLRQLAAKNSGWSEGDITCETELDDLMEGDELEDFFWDVKEQLGLPPGIWKKKDLTLGELADAILAAQPSP
jgi:hypothetical protein